MNRRDFVAAVGVAVAAPRMLDLGGDMLHAQPKDESFRDEEWTTMDGRRIKLRDMENGHLRNTILYLNKRHGQLTPRTEIGQIELKHTPAYRWPMYDSLIKEARHRGLGF